MQRSVHLLHGSVDKRMDAFGKLMDRKFSGYKRKEAAPTPEAATENV